MTIEQALTALGASQDLLTADERESLDRDGFLFIPGVLSQTQVDQINARLDAIAAEEGDRAGVEVHQEAGTLRMANLVDKGDEFEPCYSTPKVLAAVAHVLNGDLKLSSLNARFALPGEGLQGLHADWGRLETEGDFQVCNSIWLLDDFTTENGATRAVPGSHRFGTRLPGDDMADSKDTHPEEKLLLGPAGSVFVFNSHTWHGGTTNRTSQRRRACHSYFSRRHQAQQLDQKANLRLETVAKLSEAQRTILDC